LVIPKGHLRLREAVDRLAATLRKPEESETTRGNALIAPWNARSAAEGKIQQAFGDGDLTPLLQSRVTGTRIPSEPEQWRIDGARQAFRMGRWDEWDIFLPETDLLQWMVHEGAAVATESDTAAPTSAGYAAPATGSGGEEKPASKVAIDQRSWHSLLAQQGPGKHRKTNALKAWVAARYGKDLPGRDVLLKDFRSDFGPVPGISQRDMRLVRKACASSKSKLGGAPAHKRDSTAGGNLVNVSSLDQVGKKP